MTEKNDIRWLKRFENYIKAFNRLKAAVELSEEKGLSELETQGLIQSFEYTYELAWNVMKDYLNYQGITNINGPRDAFRECFSAGLIADGEIWMDMIISRNVTVHTYNEEAAGEIAEKIINSFFTLFLDFQKIMLNLLPDEEKEKAGK